MLLLASQSPRRRELLSLIGFDFQVAPAVVDEQVIAGEEPRAYVLRLAAAKAQAVAPLASAGWVVLGSDTAVVDGDQILGKPASPAEAVAMLQSLRGRHHQVYSAVSVLKIPGQMVTDFCVTEVPMRPYHDEEIQAYVATGDPMDKAGAYAIQHAGFHPVEYLDGCYANVMGLPLCHLVRTLRKLKISPRVDVPTRCQAAIGYACPVYDSILRGN
jgi:MAF protein